MSQQTQQSSNVGPAIAPLRTLAELGDEGIRRAVETDLALLFRVDSGWYERHWYGDRSPSTWGILVNTARSLCREAPRVGATICRSIVRATSVRIRFT